MLNSLVVWDVDFRFGAAGTDAGSGALRHPRLVSAGCPYNAAGFHLTSTEIDPIPAGGQPKRSHPISVPGDEITPRIRRCHVPNKNILGSLGFCMELPIYGGAPIRQTCDSLQDQGRDAETKLCFGEYRNNVA